MKILVSSFLLFAFGFAAEAATSYRADPDFSKIEWEGRKLTGAHDGFIRLKEGKLTVDGNQIKSGEFVVDMKAITVEDMKPGESRDKLLNHLNSEDFFAVEKHPEAKLIITKYEVKKQEGAETQAEVTGNLTIRGVTHEVKFPAEVEVNNNSFKMDADLKIDRTKFGIQYNSGKFFDLNKLGDKMIYDEFELEVKIFAKQS